MVAPLAFARAVALILAIGGSAAASAAEDPVSVGVVDKVEYDAKIVSAGNVVTAAAGVSVHMRDKLETGPEGRLKLTFRDGTELTLGEKASVVIDRYIYDPDRDVGEAVLQATRGAFRFASGGIEKLKQNKIAVSTPMADIGVRGTEFWGGALDGQYGVLLLEGEIVVSNQAGSVILSAQGQGTDIASPFDPPGPASAWSEEKIAKAVATVTLH